MRHCQRHKTHSSSPTRQTTNKMTTTTTVTTTAMTTTMMTHPSPTRWPNRTIQETTNKEIKECADRDARTRGLIVNTTTTL